MEKTVIDTDIIVDYARGSEAAAQFLDSVAPHSRFITVLTFMEVLQGARNARELKKLDSFLTNTFTVLTITPRSSGMALDLIRAHSRRDGLRMGDALIAAVTIENQCTLGTGNYRHFRRIPGLAVKSYSKISTRVSESDRKAGSRNP